MNTNIESRCSRQKCNEVAGYLNSLSVSSLSLSSTAPRYNCRRAHRCACVIASISRMPRLFLCHTVRFTPEKARLDVLREEDIRPALRAADNLGRWKTEGKVDGHPTFMSMITHRARYNTKISPSNECCHCDVGPGPFVLSVLQSPSSFRWSYMGNPSMPRMCFSCQHQRKGPLYPVRDATADLSRLTGSIAAPGGN